MCSLFNNLNEKIIHTVWTAPFRRDVANRKESKLWNERVDCGIECLHGRYIEGTWAVWVGRHLGRWIRRSKGAGHIVTVVNANRLRSVLPGGLEGIARVVEWEHCFPYSAREWGPWKPSCGGKWVVGGQLSVRKHVYQGRCCGRIIVCRLHESWDREVIGWFHLPGIIAREGTIVVHVVIVYVLVVHLRVLLTLLPLCCTRPKSLQQLERFDMPLAFTPTTSPILREIYSIINWIYSS